MIRTTAKKSLNAIARTALKNVPLSFWETVFPKDLIALCYHLVSDEEVPHARLYPYKGTQQFRDDIRYARQRSVTYAQVAGHRLRGEPLPRNAMIFTFDDGFAECYDVVRPILLAERVDAVFFVTTALLDDRTLFFESALSLCVSSVLQLSADALENASIALRLTIEALHHPQRVQNAVRRLRESQLAVGENPARMALLLFILGLTESDGEAIEQACSVFGVDLRAYVKRRPIFLSSGQVSQLARDGFTIGAHGVTHRSLEPLSIAEIEQQIVESCRVVKQLTNQERVPFAFPYSGVGIDRAALESILRRNADVDLIFDSGCLRRDPPFIVNRVFADMPHPGFETSLVAALSEAWSVPSAWFRSS